MIVVNVLWTTWKSNTFGNSSSEQCSSILSSYVPFRILSHDRDWVQSDPTLIFSEFPNSSTPSIGITTLHNCVYGYKQFRNHAWSLSMLSRHGWSWSTSSLNASNLKILLRHRVHHQGNELLESCWKPPSRVCNCQGLLPHHFRYEHASETSDNNVRMIA